MSEPSERLAKLESWRDSHEDRCKERYGAISKELTEIKGLLSDGFKDAKSAAIRIHERIDGENDAINERLTSTNSKISGQKVWILTNVIALLLGIVAWGADKILGKGGAP
ncbi:MAG: hypothetical protein JNK21_08810 [Rhodospirillaceae bacterium]|nr:hypothetical protein [Rhodospirillaceae bacterium]